MSERMKRKPYKDITVKKQFAACRGFGDLHQFAGCRGFGDFHMTHVQPHMQL
jgi:hypothetical protein